MRDATLAWMAITVALIGMLLLFFVKTDETQGYVLKGKVLSVHGREAVVLANVTLIAQNSKKGAIIEQPVFWNGEAFVASR